jgi:hypothetical protein
VINEFKNDNPLDNQLRLVNKASTLDYRESFEILAKIYNEYCWFYRITISPTGSKMQALACALFKMCCPDVHIEYPTPESYLVGSYSSKEIKGIHCLEIGSLKKFAEIYGQEFKLNG